MILNLLSGSNLTQFRDLDILVGLLAIVYMFMVDLNMKFQIFLLRKYVNLTLKNCSKNMKICYKKLSLQKKLEKKMIKIKRKP
jgi:hypothetical protein